MLRRLRPLFLAIGVALVAAALTRGLDVEQTSPGDRPPPIAVASFDGLGVGFSGPQGTYAGRNPSDNSLAVGPDHIVQIVNSRMAIYTKKGSRFDTTGRVLYGPVETRNVFRGFGGPCDQRNNGDAVVRYDQLANRWLIVMPIFSRIPDQTDDRPLPRAGEPARKSLAGIAGQPGPAVRLYEPPPPPPPPPPRPDSQNAPRDTTRRRPAQPTQGVYAMCYAISTGADPFGPYYRYEFIRPLFPDYPRPAVWPDGYYVPTSTGDEVIQKHACVVERAKMLIGGDAAEQCVVIDSVNFLNNADVDGKAAPPRGAPNVMMAAGGMQLQKIMEDSVILAWSFHVDWSDPSKTRVDGPKTHPRRAVPLPVRRAAHELRAAARRRTPARCAGRQADGASRVSARRRPRIDRRGALREHESGRRRRALVRVPDRPDVASPRFTSRERTRRTAHSDGWRVRPSTRAATSESATRTEDPVGSPASGSRRVSPATRSDASLFTRPCWRREKRRRPTRCGGRTTRRPPSIRRMTARSGTSATTSNRARRATRRASVRFAFRGVRSNGITRAIARPAHGATTEMTTLSVRIPRRARMAVEPADVRSKVADNA